MENIKEHCEEPLQIIPTEKLRDLLQILETELPQTLYVHGILLNVIMRRQISGKPSRTKIYAPHGNFQDGSFVSITRETDTRNGICFFSLDPLATRVENALKKTSIIDWSSNEVSNNFDGICDKFLPIVERIRSSKNLKKTYEIKLVNVWMKREDALTMNVECPPELRIDYLSPKNAKQINDSWPFKFPDSETYIRKMVESNFGLGLYLRDSNELIGWAIFSYYSGMASLHTLQSHRNKGFAKLMCNAMAKHSAEIGIDPRAIIWVDNKPSRSLFSKLGFNTCGCTNNIELEPIEN